MNSPQIKIGLISLGCAKNLADTESVVGTIKNMEIVEIKEADIAILNTCGFLQAARDEAYSALKKLANKKVILLGCLVPLLKKDFFTDYPQVKAIVSSSYYPEIEHICHQVLEGEKIYAVSPSPRTFEETGQKMLLGSGNYAYLKIAEGCDNACSYCLIPLLKGKYRSRPTESILSEAEGLINFGVKELILVAQDCGCYGVDLTGKFLLPELLQKLADFKGDFWIRVLYLYPERLTPELLPVIKNNKKICHYLDIPLQHGDHNVLKAMKRMSDLNKIYDKINHIRKLIPDIVLRTSLIVGFPGETEPAFNNLKEFVKNINFHHVGVFEYSREKGTKAYHLPDQIAEKVKAQRQKEIMLLQQKISLVHNQKLVGSEQKVLIEYYDAKKKQYLGRAYCHAPEVDGQILIKSNKKLKLNQFYSVKIIRALEYDLEGTIVK